MDYRLPLQTIVNVWLISLRRMWKLLLRNQIKYEVSVDWLFQGFIVREKVIDHSSCLSLHNQIEKLMNQVNK